jgi:hypothetical protein
MGTWEKDEQIASADDDVSQEDILAALKDATGEGFVAWIDVRATYDRILSDRYSQLKKQGFYFLD